MDESTWTDRILTAARQRLNGLADPPALDEEAVQRRRDELVERLQEGDASAWEAELERQVLLALEDVLTPGQWRTVMGSSPFADGESDPALPLFDSPALGDAPRASAARDGEDVAEDPAAMRTARGLDGLELLDAACREPGGGDPADDAVLDADIGTYGAALWSARPRQGVERTAPLGALSGAMLPAPVDPDPSDTRRLNRQRRALGGVESHRPLGPMGACFPEAALSRRPASEPPDQDLAALPDAILDDLAD